MKFDQELDRSLKKLDKDIIWHKDRQQRIRDKLIDNMSQHKTTRVSKRSGRMLPVFSFIAVVAIVTLIFIAEMSPNQIALNQGISQRTAGYKPHKPELNIADNHEEQNLTEQHHDDNQQANTNDAVSSSENDDSTEEHADSNETTGEHSEERFLTQAEIMEAIKGQMVSDLPLKLPSKITLPEGKRLTAITAADATSYEVIFYQHDEPIPINNQLLFSDENPADVVARIQVKKYDTQKEADDVVAYEAFDEHVGSSIKLTDGLTGYQEGGTGTVWTSWNVGRWALTTQAHSSEQGKALAKEAIAYLEKYMLPAPKQHGYAHLNAENGMSQIIWEKETTVYTIDQITDPLLALEIAVNFEY